jgi:hypothetical protein
LLKVTERNELTEVNTSHPSSNRKVLELTRGKFGTIQFERNSTTDALTAAILIYAIGAGITAAAGTRLALQ